MKKIIFAIIIAIASALSAHAQVLTSETINNVYEPVDKMVYILNPMHQDNNPLS